MKKLFIITLFLTSQKIYAQEKVYKVHEALVSNSSGQFYQPFLYKFEKANPGPSNYENMSGNFNPTNSFFLTYTSQDVDKKVLDLKDSISSLNKKINLLSDTVKIQKDQLRVTFKNGIDSLPKAIFTEEVSENIKKNLLDELLNFPLADLKTQVANQEKAILELRKLIDKQILVKKSSNP